MVKINELGKSKSKGVTSGVTVKGGSQGMLTGIQRTGAQRPGVSGVSMVGKDSGFALKGGNGKMFGGQQSMPASAGRVGGGRTASGPIPTSGRKRYADDASGNTMGGPNSKSS